MSARKALKPHEFRTRPSKMRARRRAFGIHAYIGANGGGKSLAAVYDTLPTLAAGRPVVSTVRILDPYTLDPHPLWVPLADYRTLLDVERADVLLDEVTGVASSRESAGMPAAIANHLVQLRRRDVVLRWTAPSWKRADTIIRECSQAVTLCRGLMGEVVKDSTTGNDRQWSAKRLFFWRTYDAAAFDEWTLHKKEDIRPVARQLLWRPGSMAERSYDTFDAVLSLGAVTEGGQCMDCGGKRTAVQCGCASYVDKKNAAKPAAKGRTLTLIPETDDTPSVVLDHAH